MLEAEPLLTEAAIAAHHVRFLFAPFKITRLVNGLHSLQDIVQILFHCIAGQRFEDFRSFRYRSRVGVQFQLFIAF